MSFLLSIPAILGGIDRKSRRQNAHGWALC